MSITHVVGIDPGLVHTGVVCMVFNSSNHEIVVDHHVVLGPDAPKVRQVTVKDDKHWPKIFIEGYRPRSHFVQDKRMVEALQSLRMVMPSAKVLDNTGVKKVVRRPFMEMLGVWKFTTPTNHDDLRSAARILLLGMLKDEQMNKLLSDVVLAKISGKPWSVVTW